MSRQVRRVPADWQHPTEPSRRGGVQYKPLHDGYADAKAEWVAMYEAEGYEAATEYWGGTPMAEEYMPDWPEAERTHLMMYETTTEGTPISPAFATPEELARWLANNGASAFGGSTATYEQWLRTCQGEWAPSMVFDGTRMMSGVEFNAAS